MIDEPSSREYWNNLLGVHAAYNLGLDLLGGELDTRTRGVMGDPPPGFMEWLAKQPCPYESHAVKPPGYENWTSTQARKLYPRSAEPASPQPDYDVWKTTQFHCAAATTADRSPATYSLTDLVRSFATFVARSVSRRRSPPPFPVVMPEPANPSFKPFVATKDGKPTFAARARGIAPD